MSRLRLLDFRLSDGPIAVGLCQGDIASCANIVNSAQRRLIYAREAGNEGWWGAWARIAFNVLKTNPYITGGRGMGRIINVTACRRALAIQNSFYEFLEFGIGLQPTDGCCASLSGAGCQFEEMYDRDMVPTFSDLAAGSYVRVYSSSVDAGNRVLLQGTDQNDLTIRSQDGLVPVEGEYLTFQAPFVQSPMTLNSITGIQKDITNFPVKFYEVNATTGDERSILTMEPTETVSGYRRYFLNGLPNDCCSGTVAGTVQVQAMVKLELIPVQQDPDYLLVPNLEALILECQAIRFDGMDSPSSDKKAAMKHHSAIGMLNGELTHRLGKTKPAVLFAPFGSATLARQGIGTMI